MFLNLAAYLAFVEETYRRRRDPCMPWEDFTEQQEHRLPDYEIRRQQRWQTVRRAVDDWIWRNRPPLALFR